MMNKNDFNAELRKELNGLPDSDIQRSIDFYTEMIEDKIEDGMTEENAVSELETPAGNCKKGSFGNINFKACKSKAQAFARA